MRSLHNGASGSVRLLAYLVPETLIFIRLLYLSDVRYITEVPLHVMSTGNDFDLCKIDSPIQENCFTCDMPWLSGVNGE
jgi:hypothetical protein